MQNLKPDCSLMQASGAGDYRALSRVERANGHLAEAGQALIPVKHPLQAGDVLSVSPGVYWRRSYSRRVLSWLEQAAGTRLPDVSFTTSVQRVRADLSQLLLAARLPGPGCREAWLTDIEFLASSFAEIARCDNFRFRLVTRPPESCRKVASEPVRLQLRCGFDRPSGVSGNQDNQVSVLSGRAVWQHPTALSLYQPQGQCCTVCFEL